MKPSIKASSLCGILLLICGSARAVTPKYPRLTNISGKVISIDRDGKSSSAKANQRLIEKAEVETSAGGKVTLEMDEHRRVQLWPETRVQLPSISWETGEAPVVRLKSGTVRWQQSAKGSYNIALTSDLFEFLPPNGDYIFRMDPKSAVAEVKVVEGHIAFSAMHAEDTAEVSAGQKCQFQGVRENGEIVYDVLLQGKKIPRGHLGKVLPFSAAEKRQYSGQGLKKEALLQQQQKKAEALAKTQNRDPLQICSNPGARLNQCAWICVGNPAKEHKVCRLQTAGVSCLRKRCNANGEWAEDTEIPQEKAAGLCGATPRVKECDY